KLVAALLHVLAATRDETDRIAEFERAREDERRIFAERETRRGHDVESREIAFALEHAEDRAARRQDRGLAEPRRVERLRGPLEAGLRDVEAERLARLVEALARHRERVHPGLSHPDVLRALAREQHGRPHHRRTIDPQVSPAPNATQTTYL